MPLKRPLFDALVSVLRKRALFVVVLATALTASWSLRKGAPRTFTVSARELALDTELGPFDNADKLAELEGTLDGQPTASPCPVQVPDAVAKSGECPAAPVTPESGAATAHAATCKLHPDDTARIVNLRTSAPGAAHSLELGFRRRADVPTPACPWTLRADGAENGASKLTWIPGVGLEGEATKDPGPPCIPELTVELGQGTARATASGLACGDPIGFLGDATHPTTLLLPVASKVPLRLALTRIKDGERGLGIFARKLPLRHLRFVTPVAVTFSHKVGLKDAVESICEAAPESRVDVRASDAPLTLQVIRVSDAELELGFTVTDDWTIDTGTCRLSSSDMEWKAFVLVFAGFLVTLGFCSWGMKLVL